MKDLYDTINYHIRQNTSPLEKRIKELEESVRLMEERLKKVEERAFRNSIRTRPGKW